MSNPNTDRDERRNWTPREFAEHVVAQWPNYANPADAVEALLKERDNQNGYDAGVLTPDELTGIRRRRAMMLFPDGRPTGPWLDIDRLLAHQEALRLAINVRNQAISKQVVAATRMRDRCVERVKRKADGYQKDSERSDYLPNYRKNMALAASTLREVANDLESLTLEQGEQEKPK